MEILRPYLSRIIAPIITYILAWLAGKTGIVFDSDATKTLTEGAILIIVPILLVVNGVIHKTLDKYFNPGDAASSHLAAAEKMEVEAIKK